MSGLKKSTVELKKEKEEKLKLLANIAEATGRLSGLATMIRETLNKTPLGVRETFEKEVKDALTWLKEIEHSKTADLSIETATGNIVKALSQFNTMFSRGQNVSDILIVSFTQKANAIERGLVSQFSQLKSTYYGCKELLDTWFEMDEISKCENSLNDIEGLLNQKKYNEVGKAMARVKNTLDFRLQEARELEYKHQKRLYVLKALRQKFKEWGFEETKPRYEQEGKRKRLVYDVDALDGRKIRFFLSLDGISTRSAIVEDRCLDEFDKLSYSLDEEFGIKTRFRVEGEKPDEKRIAKGEIDIPEGNHMEKSV